eukprot:TRINITY_DN25000_c0_g1_i3.p1 TRINITY_DN25000_c0_g1~~TRINITY_DN25000_c0_g1_i3.p1  ORF type:complete len:117 (-),score=15.26 TRINITY_DN25000_c0_g1_i3:354-704(-)
MFSRSNAGARLRSASTGAANCLLGVCPDERNYTRSSSLSKQILGKNDKKVISFRDDEESEDETPNVFDLWRQNNVPGGLEDPCPPPGVNRQNIVVNSPPSLSLFALGVEGPRTRGL